MPLSVLQKVIGNSDSLQTEEYFNYLDDILHGRLSGQEVAAFLATLAAKPLNEEDIVRFVGYMDRTFPRRQLADSTNTVNIVGTGGGIETFNISTTAAFVASAAGAVVLKSGSYSYNSRSGSLDVLSALGISPTRDPHALEDMLDAIGLAFVSPDSYAPLLKRMAISILPLPFKQIGKFINTIGPMLCPYITTGQVTGVARKEHLSVLAGAMCRLERTNSVVVHAEIGMDEFSSIGNNHYIVVGKDGDMRHHACSGTGLGFQNAELKALEGGSPQTNARLLNEILCGELSGAARDTVLLNSAAMLHVAGVVSSFESGIELAKDALKSGLAKEKLRLVSNFSALTSK